MSADYEAWHKEMATVEVGQDMPLYPWHQTVLRLLPDLGNKRVLEIGCGRGDFACFLSQLYPSASFIATDFSANAIEMAQSRAGSRSNVSFRIADAQSLPFKDASFDYVISCECLEHVESPPQMLCEMARCLSKDGGFTLTTENYFNGMILAWIKSWMAGEPFNSGSGVQPRENFFVFWKVRQMIENAGLNVTHMESNHFVWLLLPRFAPDTFFTRDFGNRILKRIFLPFGRHFTYQGIRREQVLAR